MGKRKSLFVVCACILFSLLMVHTVLAYSGVSLNVGDKLDSGYYITKNTEYTLTRGAVENVIVSNNTSGTNQCIGYFCTADIADESNYLKIVVCYSDNDGSTTGLMTTTQQAAAYERDNPGETVVAAINGDIYNMQTGQPLGALVMNGVEYNGINSRAFFGILEDGTAVICDGNGKVVSDGAYKGQTVSLSDFSQAVGGYVVTVANGVINYMDATDDYAAKTYSRTAIGIKEDGTVVTYATRGANAPTSCGETFDEVSAKMLAAGCTCVLELDGGGSTTYASLREGETSLTVKNSPSDGSERNIASTILLVSTAPEDGTFDHATLTPNDEYYTPGTTVEFTVTGADAYGTTVDLPDGYVWALSEDSESLGTITQTGVFTSNGKTGDVTAQILLDGEVVGSTTIHIVEPDTIGFSSSSLSLDFGEESDLGVYIRYNNCDVNLTEGSLDWEITSLTAETTAVTVTGVWDDEDITDGITVQLGLLDAEGNFTAVKDQTVTLNEDNGWTYTFTDLYVYQDIEGNTVSYAVQELDTPDGYKAVVSGDADTGYTITNTLKSEEDEDDTSSQGSSSVLTAFAQKMKYVGQMVGDIFVAQSDDQSMQYDAEITVTYTKANGTVLTDTVSVTIGRMPDILYDFELDEDGNALQVAHYAWGMEDYSSTGYIPENFTSLDVITANRWSDLASPTISTITVGDTGGFFFTGNYEAKVPAADIFGADGYTFYLWPNAALGDRSVGYAAVTDTEDGEVKFGDYSLDLYYDYTKYNEASNANFYIRYCGEDIVIDGTPTSIGMWVYAPEGTANFRIAVDVASYDSNKGCYVSNNIYLQTAEGSDLTYTGINWEGWMYCYADLTDLAQYVDDDHPLLIRSGTGFIWFNYTPAGKDVNGNTISLGDTTSGHVYFDNVRVVYGSTADDLDNPEVTSITANGVELAADGSTVLTSSSIVFNTSFADVDGDNASGIDASKTVILIDEDKYDLKDAEDTFASTTATLTNGTHTIRVIVQDVYGNQSSLTRTFTVDDEVSITPTVKLTGGDSAYVGENYTLTLYATKGVATVTAKIKVDSTFDEPTITAAEGYEVTSSKYSNGVLTLEIQGDTEAEGSICAISFYIPNTIAQSKSFVYTLTSCKFTNSEGESWNNTQAKKTVSISARCSVDADVMVAGSDGGNIYVTDEEGNLVSGATIYQVTDDGDVELGVTGDAGALFTDAFCEDANTSFTIYAKTEAGVSYTYTGTISSALGNEDGTPSQIAHNGTSDGSSEESITWFSNPLYANDKAYVQYKLTSGTTVKTEGTCTLTQFAQSKDAVLVNTVTLTGLQANTTYTYRVGDGTHWSDWEEFTTSGTTSDSTKFFVIGDTQLSGSDAADTTELALLKQIGANIMDEGVTFGIQTGDYLENAGYSKYWTQIMDAFGSAFGTTDIIHVMGNHELFGDTTGNTSRLIFNYSSDEEQYYSVEYGNVYVAVINNDADMEEAAAWLVEDASKTSCQWKVLAVHQPAYYTNASGGSEGFNKNIPAMAEAAGIDVVFSGHDHSYARTNPLTDGEVDEENGIIYFICGDLGEKSRSSDYVIGTEDKFSYAMVTQDYDAIYLMVDATSKYMSITVHDADGTVIDEVVLETECSKEGCDLVYDAASGKVLCSVCGTEESTYTGFIDDVSGNTYYLVAGEVQTGWLSLLSDDGEEETAYYFNAKGVQQTVTLTEDIATTCTVRGYRLFTCKTVDSGDDTTFEIQYDKASGHTYDENRVCQVCGWTEVSLEDCEITLNYSTYSYTGSAIKPYVKVTCNGVTLTSGVDYKVTYSNNTNIGTGKITITAISHYMGDNVNDKGSIAAGSRTVTFKIRPSKIKTLTATSLNTSVTLTWNKSLGASGYKVYKWSSAKGKYVLVKNITSASTTSYKITGLTAGLTNSYKVTPYVVKNGVTYIGTSKKIYVSTKPYKVKNLKVTSTSKGKLKVTWTKGSTCTGYQIRYSTSSSFSTYTTVKVTSASQLSKTISSLKSGKTYYVKVRAYKSRTNATTTYSSWSSVKKIKVK